MSTRISPNRRKRITPLGERLLLAFKETVGTEDKAVIAKALGFETDKAIYKVINGERELSFEHLEKFKSITGYSTDWLLFGEKENISNGMAKTENSRSFSLDDVFEDKIRAIVNEEFKKREQKEETEIGFWINDDVIFMKPSEILSDPNDNLSDETRNALRKWFIESFSIEPNEKTKTPIKVKNIKADTKRLSMNFDSGTNKSGVSDEALKADVARMKKDPDYKENK